MNQNTEKGSSASGQAKPVLPGDSPFFENANAEKLIVFIHKIKVIRKQRGSMRVKISSSRRSWLKMKNLKTLTYCPSVMKSSAVLQRIFA
jgi:hypothetical protein